jgi:hypothetical protein
VSDVDQWAQAAASSERARLAREQVRTQVQAQLAAGAPSEAKAVGLAATQWSSVASPALIAAAAKYGPQLPPGAVEQMMAGAAKKKAGGGGWKGKLAGAVGKVGSGIEWATPDPLGSVIKGAARGATSAMSTPVEMVQNVGAAAVNQVTGAGEAIYNAARGAANPNGPSSTPGRITSSGPTGPTAGVGSLGDVVKTSWEGTSGAHIFDANQGSGWFLGDQAVADREAAKREVKGVLAITTDGKVITYDPDKTYDPSELRGSIDPVTGEFTPKLMTGTVGRNIGRAIGSDVDDLGYQVMSGLIDTVVATKGDPMNKLSAAYRDTRAIRSTIAPAAEHLDEARAAAGLVDGSRKFVHPQRAEEWLTSAQGRAVVEWHTTNTNAAEAFRKLGSNVDPAVARNLAEATTVDETRAVLNGVLGLEAGLMSTKQLPGAVRTNVAMTRPVAAITSKWERSATERWLDQQGAKVWNDTVIVGANVSRQGKIDAVKAIDNMLATTRVPLDTRDMIVTKMIEGLTDGSQEGILKARNAASMAQLEQYVDAGIPRDFAMMMTRHTGGDDYARIFAMDALANNDDFGLVKVISARETAEKLANGQMALPGLEDVDLRAVGPLGLSDGWTGLMEMPDARQIKSIINPLGNIWSIGLYDPENAGAFSYAAQKLHLKRGVNADTVRELLASGDPDSVIAAQSMLEMVGAPRFVPAVLDSVQSKVWKPTVVMRVATVLRVLGEEQARLAEAGLVSSVNHPLQSIALASNHSIIGSLDITGSTASSSHSWTTTTPPNCSSRTSRRCRRGSPPSSWRTPEPAPVPAWRAPRRCKPHPRLTTHPSGLTGSRGRCAATGATRRSRSPPGR